MTRRQGWLERFGRLATVALSFALILLIPVGLVVFSVPTRVSQAGNETGGLPLVIARHPKVFVFIVFGVVVWALVASRGLVRRQRWAVRSWIALVMLALVWTVVAIFSSFSQVWSQGEASLTGFDRWAPLLAVLGPGLIFLFGLPYLLRRLVIADKRM
jgi:hypothetical protein